MARTKQKTRAELTAELSENQNQYLNLKNVVDSFKQAMGDLFENKGRYSYNEPMHLDTIGTAVKALMEKLKIYEILQRESKNGRAEGERFFAYEKEAELNRLWYMIRVSLKDPTLGKIDYADVDTGNGKPFSGKPFDFGRPNRPMGEDQYGN